MRHDPHDLQVAQWRGLRVERRARAVTLVQRLSMERNTRAAGRFPGTRATAFGDVQSRPRLDDPARVLLAFFLVVAIVAVVGVALNTAQQDLAHAVRPAMAQQSRTVTIAVSPHESLDDLAAVLQRDGLIVNAGVFYWYWYLRPGGINGGELLQGGVHVLNTRMTMEEIAGALAEHHPPR